MATQAREWPHNERLASSLGWFSIGLGLAEVAAPRKLAELIGVKEHTAVIRGLGLREILSGIGILSQRRPASFLRSRVAGDALDLSLGGEFELGQSVVGPRNSGGRPSRLQAGDGNRRDHEVGRERTVTQKERS